MQGGEGGPAVSLCSATAPWPCLPLQVEWVNPADPTKGFKYLFLSPEDYASLMERGAAAGGPAPVKAERLVTEDGEERWQLTGGCGACWNVTVRECRPVCNTARKQHASWGVNRLQDGMHTPPRSCQLSSAGGRGVQSTRLLRRVRSHPAR